MIDDPRWRTDELDYDPATGTYHLYHDWESTEPLSYSVMKVFLGLPNHDPTANPPLVESVDLDALDQLFDGDGLVTDDFDFLQFSHQGCRITVQRNGRVSAYPDTDEGQTHDRNPDQGVSNHSP